jgi:glutathione-specific gamma-glutamylcyclotransferase
MDEARHLQPARPMRLTAALAARVPPYDGPPLEDGAGFEKATEDDHVATFSRLMATRPDDGEVWLFAYGSLIWNPNFAHDAECTATVHGWHRAFCLGWMRSFRGSPERPGLMMALDRGGSCSGVAFRLPMGQIEDNLMPIIRRELPFKLSGLQARWLRGRTSSGPRQMIGFPMAPRSDAHVTDQSEDQIVAMLATSAGPRGTMAEYLQSTVSHLEERGIRDGYLWRLQDRVARQIAAAPASTG